MRIAATLVFAEISGTFKLTDIVVIGSGTGQVSIGSDLVKLSTNHDFVKMVLNVALGNTLEFNPSSNNFAFIKFILSPKDLATISQAASTCKDTLYYQSPVHKFDHQVTDSSTRMGFAIYRTSSRGIANTLKEILFNEKS